MTQQRSEFVEIRRGPGVELQHGRYRDLSFPKHSHDDYAISMNYNAVEAIWLDGKTYTAVPGQIVAYNPGEVQSGGSSAPEGWEFRGLHIDLDWLRTTLGESAIVARGYPILRRPIIDDANAGRLMASLSLGAELLNPDDPQLIEFVGLLFERHGEQVEAPRYQSGSAPLRRAIDYMQEHLANSISLSELSAVSGLSPYYLVRACRRLTGFPPHQLHLQLRLQRARRLLAQGLAIADVAHRLGFSDQSHLQRLFRRAYGVTPGQYRAGRG